MRSHQVDTDIEFQPGGGKGRMIITVHETDQRIEVPLYPSKQEIVDSLALRIAEAYAQGASEGVDTAVKDCINTLIACEYHDAARVIKRCFAPPEAQAPTDDHGLTAVCGFEVPDPSHPGYSIICTREMGRKGHHAMAQAPPEVVAK